MGYQLEFPNTELPDSLASESEVTLLLIVGERTVQRKFRPSNNDCTPPPPQPTVYTKPLTRQCGQQVHKLLAFLPSQEANEYFIIWEGHRGSVIMLWMTPCGGLGKTG